MTETSPRLGLPFLMPRQNQPHVTHNEALQRLDLLAQMHLQAIGATTPPVDLIAGEAFAIGSTPSGAWAGHAGEIALWNGEAWLFFQPQQGWLAVDPEGAPRIWHAGQAAWIRPLPDFDKLGINATADAVNRLTSAAPATLLTHEGHGHRLKINKAGPGDTASLLFQSNWAGRAEIGLAGDDDFSIKVSADGSNWTNALAFDADTGLAGGAAIQQGVGDTTSGRIMLNGAFGIGIGEGGQPLPTPDMDAKDMPSGMTLYADGMTANKPPGTIRGAGLLFRGQGGSADGKGEQHQLFAAHLASGAEIPGLMFRSLAQDASWSDWATLVHSRNIVGPVGQGGGVPTGAVMEKGSNANGSYVRFADGMQICTTSLTFPAAQTASGALYLSGSDASWTYPSGFSAPPMITGSTQEALPHVIFLTGPGTAPTSPELAYRGRCSASVADTQARSFEMAAIGRWY